MEEYRTIQGHVNYVVSNWGNVRNKRNNKLLKGGMDKGYRNVNIDGKTLTIHRLVAMTFIENPLHKPIVDHINNIRSDNRVVNLRWADQYQNGSNSKKRVSKSGYKGVRWDVDSKVWCVNFNYCIKWGSRISKSFKHLDEAIIFRYTVMHERYGRFVSHDEFNDYNMALDMFLVRVSQGY